MQFYYPKRLSFCPNDYEFPGLGGGEASIVLLTKALAARGHKVEVFNACWDPGQYAGVTWRGAWEINDAPIPDVQVAVRFKSSILNRNAKNNLFWMLDDRTDGAIAFSQRFPNGTVIIASNAMKSRLNKANFNGNIASISLPIETAKYEETFAPSLSNICLHTSMPNRGLMELLKFWPDIRKQVPHAELYVTSGWELWGYTEEEARDRLKQTIGSDFSEEGVTFTGVLSRTNLIALQCRSRLGLFPSYFPEMFCLAAAEMSVAGRPIIASNLEALSERVANQQTGFSINGDIKATDTHEQFVQRTVDLLTNNALTDEMGRQAKLINIQVSPDYVAQQWEHLLD